MAVTLRREWEYVLADIETDNLLLDVTTIHCLVVMDMFTEKLRAFSELPVGTVIPYETEDGIKELISEPMDDGVALIENAKVVYGHNWLRYDAMVLEKLRGLGIDTTKIRDTLILSKLLWPEIVNGDMWRAKKGKMPKKLMGRHSLEAWGYRLGINKGLFGKTADWTKLTIEMVAYCIQDVRVNKRLCDEIKRKLKEGWQNASSIQLEHDIALICERQMVSGFRLDMPKLIALNADLSAEVDRLTRELQRVFPPAEVHTTFVPKRNNKVLGYVKGWPIVRTTVVPFNPGSRDQLANRLIERYGWDPQRNPNTGNVILDDDVLATLDYPEIPLIRDWFNTNKILGMVATGKNAWLKLERNGVIHGSVDTTGAITARMTHSKPNVAQTPKVQFSKDKKVLHGLEGGFGWECRELFTTVPGWVLVGADQAALELRCLGHYLAKFDGGEYADLVVNGDVHTANQKAAGLPTRDNAKTFVYGWLYGGGSAKLGEIVLPHGTEEERKKRGDDLKRRFLKALPALKQLRDEVKGFAEAGSLKAIDGRILPIRKPHAALNTLLQSAGAIACKVWEVETVKRLGEAGLQWNCWEPEKGDYALAASIHDEVQIQCRPEHADTVSHIVVEAARAAGEILGFVCPLAGEAKQGSSWASTH